MKFLIYGAGAIGCHIAYCMYQSGHEVVMVTRGKHYSSIKKKGLHIQICNNENLIIDKILKEDSRFIFLDSLNKITEKNFDYLFITVKLNDYNSQTLKNISSYAQENTAVIPPCTKIPFWWLYNLQDLNNKKFNNTEIDLETSKFFKKENIIGMTMWLSSVIESPGKVIVKHVQRGYPLKEVFPSMREKANKLRESFRPHCLSPKVDNIKSELYIKSINSLAFNLVALETEFNNLQLKKDNNSIKIIKKIMEEGEEIPKRLNLKISQTIDERIKQTLSSTSHTMSMLNDYKIGKKPEIDHLWLSFKDLIKILDINMKFTESIYSKIEKKIFFKK